MSRSNYSDDCEQWDLIRYRGAVQSAIRGARGQRAICELLTALDAMTHKSLIAAALEQDGEYCTLGVLGKARGLAMDILDAEEPEDVAKAFNIAPALAKEIAFENDEACGYRETPEQRWQRMRTWVASKVIP